VLVSGSPVCDSSAPAYRPRRPEDTALYRIVFDHLETFIAHAREHYERPLPRYVENEFRDYLKCGVFAFGFVRCKCDSCGHGSLNLNPHLHVIWLVGVFSFNEKGSARFHPLEPPSPDDLDRIVRRVGERVIRWLDRKGLLDLGGREERPNAPEAPTSLEACTQVALASGNFGIAGPAAAEVADHDDARWIRREQRFAAEHERFNLHAGVYLPAADIEGREKLCRYALRPCFALERLSMVPDGRVAYRVKVARGRRATHRIMTPLEFLARASALIPPPRFPLVRYHGVLAPNSPYRSRVVPRAPADMPKICRARSSREKSTRMSRETGMAPASQAETSTEAVLANQSSQPLHSESPPDVTSTPGATDRLLRAPVQVGTSSETASRIPFRGDGDTLLPSVLPVSHCERMLDGLLLATSPRLDWATLMRRTYATDVLACPNCHGRLRVLAAITLPDVARQILECLGLPTAVSRPARARDPTWDEGGQSEPAGID
jgi:hypothetical protein